MIVDISEKAVHYVSGEAPRAGVSKRVIHAADAAARQMSKLRIGMLILAALAIVPLLSVVSETVLDQHTARAATIFNDDFSDGDLDDGVPVTWTPFLSSQISVQDGELSVSSATGQPFPAAQVENLDISDTSLQTEFLLRQGAGVIVYVRTTAKAGQFQRAGYYGGLLADGTAVIGFDGSGEELSRTTTTLNPTQQYITMQLDAINDTLALWLWESGNSKPETPLLSVSDDSGFEGDIAVGIPGSGEAAFRYVHVADTPIPDVPEPSAAALSVTSCVMALGWMKMRRRRLPYNKKPLQSSTVKRPTLLHW
jgi:hypothetical protein